MRLRITFGLDFDTGAWPGPLAGREAVAGEVWVGPAGLLDILETRLGLRGPQSSVIERSAAMVPHLRDAQGFFAESAKVDLLGTARRLLLDRDMLWLHGWRGQAVSTRLSELHAITNGLPPGVPDRIQEVAERLTKWPVDIESVACIDLRQSVPHAWQVVFAALDRRGVQVTDALLGASVAAGDLSAARTSGFQPQFDGSLQLVRPYGPLAAAEHIAAWLAGQPTLGGTVIVGGDEALDAALHHFGLPAVGNRAAAASNTLLQILPLVLDLMWKPPDPRTAFGLLTLNPSPIPRVLAWHLVRALERWPAVGSEEWNREIEAYLHECSAATSGAEEESDGAAIRQRLELFLNPAVDRTAGQVGASEVQRRIDGIDAWLCGRLATDEAKPDAWRAAIGQCRRLSRLIELTKLAEISAAELRRLVHAATADTGAPLYGAEAGLSAVGRPGGIAGSVRNVVWWSFSRDAADEPAVCRVTSDERQVLARQGVVLPEAGVEARHLAVRWRRPLLCATETLLLVCPRRDELGDERFPHPLWDEIVSRIPEAARRRLAGRLEVERPEMGRAVTQEPRQTLVLPRPQRNWHVVAGRVSPREKESPSSIEALIGCVFNWTAKHKARLRRHNPEAMQITSMAVGNLAHLILEGIALNPPADPRAAIGIAEAMFDQRGPLLLAPLFLPGFDSERAEARRVIALAASELVRWLQGSGRNVVAVEHECEAKASFGELTGRIDLVLGPEPGVIDLKLGGRRFLREKLERGAATQLAAYSFMLSERGGPSLPPVGYFVVRDQQLLSPASAALSASIAVSGPSLMETWNAVVAAVASRHDELAQGNIEASGNPDANGDVQPDRDGIDADRMRLVAPCDWCEFRVLCGRQFGDTP